MARRKVEVRREEILRATVAEVGQRGFAHTRVADVAAALGISAGLVFYHFATKERLLAAAFGYAAERDLQTLDRAASGSGTATGRLVAVLRLYSPVGSSPGWTLWIDAWAAALREPALRSVSRRLDLRWKDTVARVIADGVADGDFVCADPHGAAWRITAMLDGLAVQTTVHKGVVARRDMTRWVAGLAEHELGLAPGALATRTPRDGRASSDGHGATPASSAGGRPRSVPAGRGRRG